MKNHIIKLIAILIVYSNTVYSDVPLEKGINCGIDFHKRTTPEQNILRSIGASYKANSIAPPSSCIGWAGSGEYEWYGVSKTNEVYGFNLSNKQYLGSWKLNEYPEHLFLSGEYLAAAAVIAADHGDEFDKPSDPLVPVTALTPFYFRSLDESKRDAAGCLENHPIRYGDLEGDGKNELVLMLGKNIVVFSTELKKVSFGMHYFMTDEMAPSMSSEPEYKHDQPDDPIYLSSSTEDAVRIGKGGLFPAWRSFSKIYVDHLASENSNDIVLWRKLYQSRYHKDPIKGFEKLGDVLVHYKMVDGEYKKQETEQGVIKGWLEAKNLTWQKGYPSKSECPGHEGQLIPEMHDPLLNDPDVLK
ncbi:hypothetical protein [Cellvibrio sp. NN19]|uniref:hypothetical protein n=1 Tax=Cellvibrio chitinivorans TaxID=3102792 RepID=UPI002B4151DC|nr:hypothetical protein [Cellvibrio sp. NN19]